MEGNTLRQKSEARAQRSEVRGQRSELRAQRSELRGQRSEVRGQRSELSGQSSELRGQRSEDFPFSIFHLQSRVARQSMTNGKWKMETLPTSDFWLV